MKLIEGANYYCDNFFKTSDVNELHDTHFLYIIRIQEGLPKVSIEFGRNFL